MQSSPNRVIACNVHAIHEADRPRHRALLQRLCAAIVKRSELADGYAYTLESGAISLTEAAEWMSLERLCCPFLELQLSVAGNRPEWLLSITGPAGVTGLLWEEFPMRQG